MSERAGLVPLGDVADMPEPPPGAVLSFDESGTWVKSRISRPTGVGLVYFIQGKTGGPVKIGFTSHNDVTGRIKTLQTSHPYPLCALITIRGSVQDERSIHKVLAPERLMGEWFEWSKRTISLIEILATRRPLADALAAISGMDVPNCPKVWDEFYLSETNASLFFSLNTTDILSKARKAGEGPSFGAAAAGSQTRRYYRLSDLKRWLVESKIPHCPNMDMWNRCVIEADLVEGTFQ